MMKIGEIGEIIDGSLISAHNRQQFELEYSRLYGTTGTVFKALRDGDDYMETAGDRVARCWAMWNAGRAAMLEVTRPGRNDNILEMMIDDQRRPPLRWVYAPVADLYAVRIFDRGSAYVRDAAEALRISKRHDNAEIVEYVHIKRLQDSYTAPPEPEVPGEQSWDELCRVNPEMTIGDAIIRAASWNACRAAMLNHSGDSANMVKPTPVMPKELVEEPGTWKTPDVVFGWNECRAAITKENNK